MSCVSSIHKHRVSFFLPPAGIVVVDVQFADVLSVRDGVCMRLVGFQKHKEFSKTVRVEEIDGLKLVKNLAVKMEEVFQKKAEATRVGREHPHCFPQMGPVSSENWILEKKKNNKKRKSLNL